MASRRTSLPFNLKRTQNKYDCDGAYCPYAGLKSSFFSPPIASLESLMADFAQTLMTTLSVGSLYALIALGYTMVYGILQFINFAHSDIVVLGAWISYTLSVKILPRIGLDPLKDVATPPLWVGAVILVAAMVACGLIGFLIERLAYRPLRRAPRLNV